MSGQGLPSNIGFLPGAYRDYERLQSSDPGDFEAVRRALTSLGKEGPPRDTRLFLSDEAGFPNGLVYRLTAGRRIVVFEPSSRLLLGPEGGPKTVRSVLAGGGESLYTVWFIILPP